MTKTVEYTEEEMDIRVIDQNLLQGTVDAKAHAKYLASLPDDADEAEETETRFGPAIEEIELPTEQTSAS
jgi:hypothetical protein